MSEVESIEYDKFVNLVSSKYSDVIGRKLGGRVISFSDEWFAAADNLITPGAPVRQVGKFTPAGAWYDGWETRRHNTEEADWVIIKLGVASAQVVGVEVDTAYFNGNHAPAISVEGTFVESSIASDAEKEYLENKVAWEPIIAKTECGPSQRHFFVRKLGLTTNKYTHVRLRMYPDGGIARFRLYGKPSLVISKDDPSTARNLELDLAHVANGGVATSFSDQHFGQVDNLLIPGRGVDMGDGWETKRSREAGHVDWVIVKLGMKGYVDRVVVDTAHFFGNYPQSITVEALKDDEADNDDVSADDERWKMIVPKTKTGPNQIHEYVRAGESGPAATDGESPKAVFQVLESGKDQEVTHVKLTIIPDGGVKRLRVYGRVVF